MDVRARVRARAGRRQRCGRKKTKRKKTRRGAPERLCSREEAPLPDVSVPVVITAICAACHVIALSVEAVRRVRLTRGMQRAIEAQRVAGVGLGCAPLPHSRARMV